MVRDSVAKPSKDAEGLRVRARLAVLAGKPGEARTMIDRSLRLEAHAEAWLVLADLQLRMDEIDDGIAGPDPRCRQRPIQRLARHPDERRHHASGPVETVQRAGWRRR